MAWREQLREASFRGVAFKVEGHDRELGRRNEVHEYPFRDRAYPEDLGRRTGRYQLDAFVIGPDYMAARDALAEALNKGGSGTLVHPYLGTLEVVCDVARQSESADEGGMAVFSITFIDAADPSTPTVRADSVAQVVDVAAKAQTLSAAGFLERFTGVNLSAFNQAEAGKLLGSASQALLAAVDGSAVQGGDLFKIRSAASDLAKRAEYYVRRPAELAGAVQGVTVAIGAAARSPQTALRAMTQLAGFGSALAIPPGLSTGRVIQRANQAAIVGLVRQSGLIQAARATTSMTFSAYDDAARVRDDLTGLLDNAAIEAGDVGDDDGYAGLDALRLAVSRDLTVRGGSLARLARITPVLTEPSLVTAYRLYGDASRADEIAARNKMTHPGFALGGRNLQVLTDV